MDHFPTLEIESESHCVLPWLITGWEHRPSQQHNSIWAKYLYRGGTTSLIHNTSIHVRESYFQSWARVIHSVCQRTSLLFADKRDTLSEKKVLNKVESQWSFLFLFLLCFSLCIRLGGILPVVSGLFFLVFWKSRTKRGQNFNIIARLLLQFS